jgi:hypothetical protein
VVPCIVFYICIKASNKMQQQYLGFIARSLYMFRALSVPIIRSTITPVDSHWYKLRRIVNFVVMSTLRVTQNRVAGSHHRGWVLTQPRWYDQPPDFGQLLKSTLPQNSRPNVTYVIPVIINCSYYTPDDGHGECPKHIMWSCDNTKILLLHLVGCLYTFALNNAYSAWFFDR